MKRQVVERLCAVAGLSLFLAIGVMLSLWITVPPSAWAQGGIQVKLNLVQDTQKISAGEYFTLTAEISGEDLLSVTEMYLEIIPPSIVITDPLDVQLSWSILSEEIGGRESLSRSVSLQSREGVPEDVYTFSARLRYYTLAGEQGSELITATGEIEIVAPEPSTEVTATAEPLPTPEPSPTSTATPITSTPSPSPEPAPTSAPETPPPAEVAPTGTPTPSSPFAPIIGPVRDLLDNQPLVALLACLVPLAVLLLALVLIVMSRRKGRTPPAASGPAASPAAPPPAGSYLEGVDAAGTAHRYPLTGELSIGRAPENKLTITEGFPGGETVSRHHARIYRQGEFWIVEDLQSSNGVYVNGKRTGLNRLFDNVKLGIGGVEFFFHAGKEANDDLS